MAETIANAATGWVPGRRIGPYALLRELARGGMAELWLARQQGVAGFDRIVAIKRILPSSEEDPSHVSLFLDEARIAAQLSHPNVVQVFDLTQSEGSFALVMEYLQGQSLSRTMRALLKTREAMDPFTAASIVSEAAAGLGYAHLKRGFDGKPLGIVHRDVSPQNIFVTYDGYVKVLDFGIAVAVGRLSHTATGTIRGKVAYMAPEQALALPVDARADVFALGVILFELLTGTRLYGGAEELQILRTLTGTSAYPGPREYRPHVPEDLDAIVRRALARDASQRYANAQVLHEALEMFVKAHPAPPLRGLMQQLFASKIAEQEQLLESLPSAPSAVTSRLSEPSLSAHLPDDAAFAPKPTGTLNTELKAAVRPSRWPLAVAALGGVALAGGVWFALGGGSRVPPAVAVAVATPAPIPSPAPAALPTPVVAQPEPELAPPPPLTVATPRVARGKLTLDTNPWTRVLLGKTPLGDTPLVEVAVPVGKQRLRLINEEEHIDQFIEVDVAATGTTVKKLTF